MKKHAYLIIAHKNLLQLKKLLSLLDDRRNDIFLLIDKKCLQFSEKDFNGICNNSSLYFINRIKIVWGGVSQIEAELELLKEAKRKGDYIYYHLLSGQDLPLHSQNYIHKFFDKYEGYEFLTFCGEEIYKKNNPNNRVQYYYPFQNFEFQWNFTKKHPVKKIWNTFFIPLQRLFRVNRCKNMKIGYGSNWFSITDDFVKYILDNEHEIQKTYKYSFCADEIFIQTLAINSQFTDRIFLKKGINDKISDRQGNLRYINWWNGNPHIWTSNDKDELLQARDRGYLFSRKFDIDIDKKIIDFIVKIVFTESENEKISVGL